jgi:catalase
MFIPLNTAAYSPNTLNKGAPKQATQSTGKGFFTAPERTTTGTLVRSVSKSFSDVWSQPRLFYNSLLPVEQQFLINAIRFETSQLKSSVVKQNVIIQLNRISNDIAKRVASAIGVEAPAPDPKYYNDKKTAFVSIFRDPLPTIKTLKVLLLASTHSSASLSQASSLATAFKAEGAVITVVGETLANGIDQTYSATDASTFDGIIALTGTESLFTNGSSSTFFPAARPQQILTDGYRWGKPVADLTKFTAGYKVATIKPGPGVFSSNSSGLSAFVKSFEGGLKKFKFTNRFPLDS